MVPLAETCDPERPRLVVHAEAVPGGVHEAMRTGAIHDAPASRDLAPAEHRACSAFVSGAPIVAARERHGIDLTGPARPNPSWQARGEDAFHAADFTVDWESRRVRCPEGHVSVGPGGARRQGVGQALRPCRVPPLGLPALPLAPAPHPRAEPAPPPSAARRARGCGSGQGAAQDRGGPAALPPAAGHRRHDLAGGARLRPATRAPPRLGQDRPAERGHGRGRGRGPRPPRRLVRRTPTRAPQNLALRRPHRVAGDFVKRVKWGCRTR